MNPTTKPLSIVIGGQRCLLYFDLNTFAAFETATGKFFLDFLASMEDAVRSAVAQNNGGSDQTAALQLMRRISIKDVRAFVWAALHTYDANDEPHWPMTEGQLGRMIDVNNIAQLIPKLLSANADNGPEVEGESTSRPTVPETSVRSDGGGTSGPSDDDALASLTMRSDG
jgi:hypothetical protein